jgi:hypothetical protein
MTTYHVWLTGQEMPETVRAYGVEERDGHLYFSLGAVITASGEAFDGNMIRHFQPHQWQRWSVVHDETDHVHI